MTSAIKNTLIFLLVLSLSPLCFAENKSAIGLDDFYFKYIKNTDLLEIMYDLEPKLIEVYKAEGFSDKEVFRGVRGFAYGFSEDKITKPMLNRLKKHSPDTLRRLAELPYKESPFLVTLGTDFRLERAKKLHKALHNGQEYSAEEKTSKN